MTDVARDAGVSIATVSFVLAGKSAVAPDTRERVLEAVQRLGYRRNRHARALRRGTATAIEVILPDITNPFYAELVAAIERAARNEGWGVSLSNAQVDPERERAYLDRALDDGPDGIVYVPMTTGAIDAVTGRLRSAPPLVLADEITTTAGIGSVSVDNENGGRLAARHFHASGRRRALVTGTPRGLPTSALRATGFVDECRKLGVEIAHVEFGEHSTLDAADFAAATIIRDRSIDAFFAGNDFVALRVLAQLLRAGTRVPEDVAICGFDGIVWGQTSIPRLTTIKQPVDRIGREIIALFRDEFDGVHNRRDVVLPVELLVGDTAP